MFLYGLAIVILAQTEISGSIEDQTSDRLEVISGSLDPTAIRFVPPLPPKPLPETPIEASAVIQKPTHSITLVRGAPSTLPDIPLPPAPAEQPDLLEFPPQSQCLILGLSVTIYDRIITHVEWRDPQTQEQFEAWCGWDWNLLAPMQEVSCKRVTYNLFFCPEEINTNEVNPMVETLPIPEHPKVEPYQFVLVDGNADSTTGEPFLEAIQRYVITNKLELEAMRAARDQYREEAEAWQKANPPTPKNHKIILRPHRGSRYLKNIAPASGSSEASKEEGTQ